MLAFNPMCDGVVVCNYVQVGLLSHAEQVQPNQNDKYFQVLPKMCDNCFEKYLNYTIYKADGPYLLIKEVKRSVASIPSTLKAQSEACRSPLAPTGGGP